MTAMRQSAELTLSANSGPSDHASTEDDFFARFPVSGHWIDGTYFSRLIGSNAAGADIGDALGMRFERPVSG
jgi:hypothetical protein